MDGSATRVRRATDGDGHELARLRWDFTLEDYQPAVEPWESFVGRFLDRWKSFYASGRWFVAVAERVGGEGRLIGCAWLETVDRVPRPIAHADQMGYLTNVYVAPASRNEGIGSALIAEVLTHARARGFAEVFVWPSDASVVFYRRAGFARSTDLHEMPLD